MFKGLSNLANLASMMKQASEIGGKMQAMSERLKSMRVTGSAGGGMIEVEVNGMGELIKLRIDPLLVQRQEVGMLEDLIPAAVNQAVANARQMQMDSMKSVTEGLDLPGVDDMLKQLKG